MTYKYFTVRQYIYEACSGRAVSRWRTFKEVRKLFKFRLWFLLGCIIFCFICAVSLYLIPSINRWWSAFPYVIAIFLSTYYKINFNSFYNKEARATELEERQTAYASYIQAAISTLAASNINTKEKRDYLKAECEQTLLHHEQKYNSLNNKTYEMLIGVPLGALVSSIIYNQSTNTLNGIILLILLGLFIITGFQVVKMISFYSDGYFKDQHLLNVLQELEYMDS